MNLTRRQALGLGVGAAAGLGAATMGALRGDPPGPNYPFGIDVSNYQGQIDWNAVVNSNPNLGFAFAKATEGTGFVDSWFNFNWGEMLRVGLYRGAYHFGHPGSSAADQAALFLAVVPVTSAELQMVLDLEVTDGRSPAQVWQWTQDFIRYIQDGSGRPGIIYTGYYFWRDQVGDPPNNLNCPLWIANYGASQPLVPRAWSTWSFWQFTSSGRVPGINGNVDLDYFNGGWDLLDRLVIR
jgi:GH25 family lysozyme M1 (1,4-beta-N-acetylmuramidase)